MSTVRNFLQKLLDDVGDEELKCLMVVVQPTEGFCRSAILGNSFQIDEMIKLVLNECCNQNQVMQ